jgi:pyruvate formate lyase activating enzyme
MHNQTLREAAFYGKLSNNAVRCQLCSHYCTIQPGKLGICQVRQNIDGILYTLVYGRVISQHVDPVEKKPLYHFYPGSTAYSIAAPGCNFRCRWCQNWQISQMPREQHVITGFQVTPEQIVAEAVETSSHSIAYTYTEPTMFFEFAYDTARLAHAAGIHNIFVSDGYMTAAALAHMQPYLDAANIDLKSFRDTTYRRYIGARLQPVLDSLVRFKQMGIWLEVTTLVIPGINDEPDELRDIARFIANELGADTPWHISRFFPGYQMMEHQPTPLSTLDQAYHSGLEAGLDYVYVGNVGTTEAYNDTRCPHCGTHLIQRRGYTITRNQIEAGRCPDCGMAIAGVGLD